MSTPPIQTGRAKIGDRRENGQIATRFSPADIERGLHAMALSGGNTRMAERTLAAVGARISATTLRTWAIDTHAQRYHELRIELVPKIHGQIAQESEDLARAYAEKEWALLDSLDAESIAALPAKEKAAAIRNMATSRAISVDKAALLRNRPTAIVEHRGADNIAKRIRDMAAQMGTTVEGSVIEDAVLEMEGSL